MAVCFIRRDGLHSMQHYTSWLTIYMLWLKSFCIKQVHFHDVFMVSPDQCLVYHPRYAELVAQWIPSQHGIFSRKMGRGWIEISRLHFASNTIKLILNITIPLLLYGSGFFAWMIINNLLEKCTANINHTTHLLWFRGQSMSSAISYHQHVKNCNIMHQLFPMSLKFTEICRNLHCRQEPLNNLAWAWE